MIKALALVLLMAGGAWAQTIVDASQTRTIWLNATAPNFAGAQTETGKLVTGASALAVQSPVGATALGITYKISVAGTATVQTEVSCDAGTTWIVVAGSAAALDFAAIAAAGVDISNPLPQCAFRTNITAIAGAGAAVTTRAYFTVRQ